LFKDSLQRAKQAERGWARKADKVVEAKIGGYMTSTCPRDPRECLRGTRLDTLLTQHLELLQSWVKEETRASTDRHLATRMLAVIEGQVSACDGAMELKLHKNASMLRHMGYRTIRVPYIKGGDVQTSEWAGISYVNALSVDRTLFVPRFGLGRIESGWFAQLASDLPPSYRVVPVQAQAVLLANGGVHCVTAIGRDASYHRW
jgi:agmatine/peptidylarginine deiminase